jgi:sugar phosphate isomerase/epimerase
MALTHPFSMQLYSARNFPPVEAQLAAIRAIGFDNVETFGPWHDDPAATRKLLDTFGLTAKSGHFALEAIEADPSRTAEIARQIGIEIVVAPYLEPERRPASRDEWEALGARLERLRERLGAEGLRFAWHNHDFEFEPLPDASYPIQHVLGKSLLWEADLAWVKRAYADPSLWIYRYRGRVPLVHVKDIARPGNPVDEDGWADVGDGTMPWRELWAECVDAGAEIMVAAHDNPKNFHRFARVSAVAMRGYVKRAGQ